MVRVLVRPQVERLELFLRVELAVDVLKGPESRKGVRAVGRGRPFRDVHGRDVLFQRHH